MHRESLKMYEQTILEYHKAIRYAKGYGMSPENLRKIEDEFDKFKLENRKNNLLILLL